MNRDVVIGVVGAVALVVVMVGVFAYEYNTYEGERWQAVVSTNYESSTLQETESRDFLFTVDGSGLSAMSVEVAWTDDVGDADTFTVALLDDTGAEIGSISGNSGPLSLDHTLQGAPGEGESMDDAWDGAQEFTVRVTLDAAPGTDSPVPVLAEADGSQSFQLTFTTTKYQSVAA